MALMLVLFVSCGESEPMMVVRVESECVYDGPSELPPGMNRLRLADEGVGMGGSVEVELIILQETSYEDVISHFASPEGRFPAPGTHVVQRLVLGAEPRAEAESVQLPPGTYALLCHMGDSTPKPFAEITVGSAG